MTLSERLDVFNPFALRNKTLRDVETEERRLLAIQESYYRNGFDWVRLMVDDLYEEEIENVESKYGVDFEIKTSGEIEAGYIPSKKRYIIYLPDDIARAIITKKNVKTKLCTALVDCLVHEDTHRQQDQPGSKQKYEQIKMEPDDTYDTLQKKKEKYYSQKTEVDAYARQVAAAFYDKNVSAKTALDSIVGRNGVFLELPEHLKNYVDTYRKMKTWRKFLCEIYRYFEEV
jgi:hypothetical protein